MNPGSLERAVARATGETVVKSVVAAFGLADPPIVDFDPEARTIFRPKSSIGTRSMRSDARSSPNDSPRRAKS